MADRLFRLSRVAFGLAVLANFLALLGQIASTGNILGGLRGALAWFNPGNTETFIGEVLLFSPAVFTYLAAEWLAKRSDGPRDPKAPGEDGAPPGPPGGS